MKNDVQTASKIESIIIHTADGRVMADRKLMNSLLLQMVLAKQKNPNAPIQPVTVGGFRISVEIVADEPRFTFKGEHHYSCAAGDTDKQDNVQRTLFPVHIPFSVVAANSTHSRKPLCQYNNKLALCYCELAEEVIRRT